MSGPVPPSHPTSEDDVDRLVVAVRDCLALHQDRQWVIASGTRPGPSNAGVLSMIRHTLPEASPQHDLDESREVTSRPAQGGTTWNRPICVVPSAS